MGLLALALAPGIFICLYIYFKDRYKREPLGLLVWAFVLGILDLFHNSQFTSVDNNAQAFLVKPWSMFSCNGKK